MQIKEKAIPQTIKESQKVNKTWGKNKKIKIQENIETGHGDQFRLVNFRIEQELEKDAADRQANAALFIFTFWKFKKYYKKHIDTGIRRQIDITDKLIDSQNNLIQNSSTPDNDLSNKEFKSPIDNIQSLNDQKIHSTAVKKWNQSQSKSDNIIDEIDDHDSEITKVLIHSTKAEENNEEIKETEENEVYREAKKNLFTYEDEKRERENTPSSHNPFEATENTNDLKDKVVHLSTINTDENLENHNTEQNFENNRKAENQLEEKKSDIDDQETENYEAQGSAMKVKNVEQLRQDFAGNDKVSKQKLFSGPDSLLREIIWHTPRSSKRADSIKDNKTYLHNFEKDADIKDDNSEAATKRRVDMSNLGASMNQNSSTSSRFFENNSSFQKFSLLQFNNMMKSKDFGVLLQLREKAVKYRAKTERKIINKMIESQKYSPRMLQRQKLELDKWVNHENEEIKKTKNQMLEKWYQTKAMIEETEKNAKLIRQQIGSLDCSRKASFNYTSPIHEHGINLEDLKSFNNMSNQVDSIKDDDEVTKIIHFSEPHRLVNSEAENLDNNQSNSYKSLRISILSNKSQDFEVNKNKIQLYKLQRTRKMNRLSSLMTSGVLDERKNQSQTIYLRNLFNNLLDESTHELDHLIKKSKGFRRERKELKVFEYQPQYKMSDNIANFDNDKTPKNILEFGNDQSSERQSKEEFGIDINKLDRVIHSIMEIEQNEERFIPQKDFDRKSKKHERILSNEKAHKRQSSSNSNIGINKWDDLDIENFLGEDEQ